MEEKEMELEDIKEEFTVQLAKLYKELGQACDRHGNIQLNLGFLVADVLNLVHILDFDHLTRIIGVEEGLFVWKELNKG